MSKKPKLLTIKLTPEEANLVLSAVSELASGYEDGDIFEAKYLRSAERKIEKALE